MSLRMLTAGLVVLAAACNGAARPGALTARWGTLDTANVTLPATARWCVGAGRIDLRARTGDTAFGVTFYPTDSVAVAASYPVWEPGQPNTYRPGAGVAVRWLSKAVIEGWWADSGAVELTGGWSKVAGQGQARLISGRGPDSTIPLAFTFRDVPLVVDTLCDQPTLPPGVPNLPESGGPPPASGVH